MKKFGTVVNACIRLYPESRRLKKEEERKERQAQEEEEEEKRKNREWRQRAREAAEDRGRTTLPLSAPRMGVGDIPDITPYEPTIETFPRHQPRSRNVGNNAPVRSIHRKPLKEALECVNPISAEDDPENGVPTIYGAGSRYHQYSRPVTFRGSQQSLELPATTGEPSELPLMSGALQQDTVEVEDSPAELPVPVPRQRRRLQNHDATRRHGRIFPDHDLPEVLRIQYVSPIAINPLTARDEEELHITPRSSTWGPVPGSQPTLQRGSNARVPELEAVGNGSIARRRARYTQIPEPSTHARVDRSREERNSLAEVFALPGHYGNGHLPLPPAIVTPPEAESSEAESSEAESSEAEPENRNTSAGASIPSLPDHHPVQSSTSASASSESLATTSSTTQVRDISPASSLLSLPSYLAPGRLPSYLRTPTPSPQTSLLSPPSTRQQRTHLSPASSLISLPSYLAPGRLPPSLRTSFSSLLSISTESAGTRSLRRDLLRVLYEHTQARQRGRGNGRESVQSIETSSSTRSLIEGIFEVLAAGGRSRSSLALSSVPEVVEGEGLEIGDVPEVGEEQVTREIAGPVAYGVRPTTSRDVLRRRASRENLRLESADRSAADLARHNPVSADGDGMEEWRRIFYTASGMHGNFDTMTSVLDGAIEAGLGGFGVEF